MIDQRLINEYLGKGFDLFSGKNKSEKEKTDRYEKIKTFLLKPDFNGFTKDDLFIMQFIKKGWGHDIAALSNMAEALVNLSICHPHKMNEYWLLLNEVVNRALHPKVRPYKKDIHHVSHLGKYGYYLEHLNIILGCYKRLGLDNRYDELNKRISLHLLENSMSYSNFHADLLPNVNMKWSADQAAIIYSLWLYDQNNNSHMSGDLIYKWLQFMEEKRKHKKTGLYTTEVLGTRAYSDQPRGCSLSYMIHYMARFAPKRAAEQWKLYKKHMMQSFMGKVGFREYLPDYDADWTPDSGPIIGGIGVAATGLALNAASSIDDKKTYKVIEKSMNSIHSLLSKSDMIPGINILSKIGTDLLSTAIWLNAESK